MRKLNPGKVVISSNCQTESIVEALRIIAPLSEFVSCEIRSVGPESYLAPLLEDGDVVLVSSDAACFTDSFKSLYPRLELIRIPQLIFPAFHPDIVYAVSSQRGFLRCLDSDYHSALVLWGWKNIILPDKLQSLFRTEVFEQLGYLNCWDESVEELRMRFKPTKIDFWQFWSKVKRKGNFMHSLNHPRVFCLAQLALLIARELGAPADIMDEPLEELVTDRLDAIRWPVYPEIAALYGVEGGYGWKIRTNFYTSLAEYINQAYASYEGLSLKPNEVEFFSDGYEQFNSIMNRFL